MCLAGCCPPARVVDVGASFDRTFAIVEDAGVRAWGVDTRELGPIPFGFSFRPQNVPLEIPAAPPSLTITVGQKHQCVMQTDGGASCWGQNSSGEVGSRDQQLHVTPVALDFGPRWPSNDRIVSVTAGWGTSCMRGASGAVGCWGSAGVGIRGDGSLSSIHVADPAQGLSSGVVSHSHSSSHALALLDDGGVVGWGDNRTGPVVSTAMPPIVSTPVPAGPLEHSGPLTQVSAGSAHSCALAADGGVWCWGKNQYGEAGVPPLSAPPYIMASPMKVPGLTVELRSVVACNFFTCALTTSGGVWCWGQNHQGQLGDGTTTDRFTPAEVTGFTAPVVKVACGAFHACALDEEQALWCWGSNDSGQLGLGPNVSAVSRPTRVPVP
jgi:alpha-tubulin suppressor-like RCC1 family protein